MENNNNFFSLYNTTEDFFTDKKLLHSHIKEIISTIKERSTVVDLDFVYSACYKYTTHIFKEKNSLKSITDDKSLSHLFFSPCIHDALITFYTLLTNNIQVSSGAAFKEYFFTYEPIRITAIRTSLSNTEQIYSIEPNWKIAAQYNRTAKKRAFDLAHKEFKKLIVSNKAETLSFSTLNASLYLASEYYSKGTGLPKLFQLVKKIETMLKNYKNIQDNLSKAYTLLSKKQGIKETWSYFFTQQDLNLFSKLFAEFYESVAGTYVNEIIYFDNQTVSYDDILQDLFRYNDKKFTKALRLFSWNNSICETAKSIHSHFYPKHCNSQKLSSFLEQLQNHNKSETLNQLENLLRDCIGLNKHKEFLDLKDLLNQIISLENKHAKLIKQLNSYILQALTEYYCSYHSNASIDSFTLYAPDNKSRSIAELCDYIQNLQLRKYIFATDLCDTGLQYYQNPDITIPPEQLKEILKEFSIPFPRGKILNHVINQYCSTSNSKKTKSVLSDIFKLFYPTFTRLFLGVISDIIKTNSTSQEDFCKCCIIISNHYKAAVSKQLTKLSYPSKDNTDSDENMPHKPLKIAVKYNNREYTYCDNIPKQDGASIFDSISDDSEHIDSSVAESFIESSAPFILQLNNIFKNLCPNNYMSPFDKFLPSILGEIELSKTAQHSKWIKNIHNRSNRLPELKPPVQLDIAEYPSLPINATWTIMMAEILTTFLTLPQSDKYIADLPKDSLKHTTK